MCRNIKPLFNFEPKATKEEIRDAATQFVRKVSGMQKPSEENQEVFGKAIQDVSDDIQKLLDHLQTNSPKKNREVEAEKAKARSIKRFGA